MKSPKWICNICKQTLTRKGNVKRHCNIKHGGLFDSIISFREYLITTSMPLVLPTNHTDHPYNINNSNQLPFQENLFSYQEKSVPISKSSYWQRTIPQRDIIAEIIIQKEKIIINYYRMNSTKI
ncbi:MAG TPA: hypothetical protein VJ697_01615 [Nitrososphaeraceae archaeon]|nr:hypothetical protein [Nitrososphaeraceae archaeon]